MKTDKFTNMLEAFECDLRLAKDDRRSLSEFDKPLQDKDSKISKDLELLEELSFLLRNGKAEIHLVSENAQKPDIQVLFRKDLIQPWEHLVIAKNGITISDRLESGKLEAVDPDDVEMLQDLIMAAVNEALRAAGDAMENEMGKMTGGLSMPGLF